MKHTAQTDRQAPTSGGVPYYVEHIPRPGRSSAALACITEALSHPEAWEGAERSKSGALLTMILEHRGPDRGPGKPLDGKLRRHLHMIAAQPRPRRHEAERLALAMANARVNDVTGAGLLREQLISGHLWLAARVALRQRSLVLNVDDLIQEATTGLIQAVDQFSTPSHTSFVATAIWHIRAAVGEALVSQDRQVALPSHIEATLRMLARAHDTLLPHPPLDDVASGHLSWHELRAAQTCVRLNAELPPARAIPASVMGLATMEEAVERGLLQDNMAHTLAQLPSAARSLLAMRYGLSAAPRPLVLP